jgi:hypothetical protein
MVRPIPERIRYWTLLRMVRSGQWSADELLADMADDVVRMLPPPAVRTLHLVGDTTLSTRMREFSLASHAPLMRCVSRLAASD